MANWNATKKVKVRGQEVEVILFLNHRKVGRSYQNSGNVE